MWVWILALWPDHMTSGKCLFVLKMGLNNPSPTASEALQILQGKQVRGPDSAWRPLGYQQIKSQVDLSSNS